MKILPHTRSCFVCGEANPLGLKLRFETDGRIVQSRFLPRAEHVGFKGTVHGGILSTVLDEIMVWACAVRTRRFAFCGELKVRFLVPARPQEEVLAVGELIANKKNKLFEAKAELRQARGTVVASATGKYLPIQQTDVTEWVTDFVGDAGWLFEPPSV
jgi:acyl-coenzyme A thioesterase PaaI-like protein